MPMFKIGERVTSIKNGNEGEIIRLRHTLQIDEEKHIEEVKYYIKWDGSPYALWISEDLVNPIEAQPINYDLEFNLLKMKIDDCLLNKDEAGFDFWLHVKQCLIEEMKKSDKSV